MKKTIPQTPAEFDKTRIVERPDGVYWQDRVTGEEFGPFLTMAEAVDDMEYSADSALEPGESLHEAEDELGISDWLDPDTGELSEDCLTHIEDH